MKLKWEIRQATAADARGLELCMDSAYSPYQERMRGERLPPMDTDYSEEIRNHPAWVADSNGSIVGGLIMIFDEDRALLANVAVDPAYQGHGIGSALISFAESRAGEKGYSALHLATHVLLSENISMYLHLGWEEVRRNRTRVVMKKKL
jgi:GNAT superfamily N-acetyltransferase